MVNQTEELWDAYNCYVCSEGLGLKIFNTKFLWALENKNPNLFWFLLVLSWGRSGFLASRSLCRESAYHCCLSPVLSWLGIAREEECCFFICACFGFWRKGSMNSSMVDRSPDHLGSKRNWVGKIFQFLDKETKGGNCRAVTHRMQ